MSEAKAIRYPEPLRPGDRIGVTAPSSGVEPEMRPRLNFAIEYLRARGYDVVVGECMDAMRVTSAPAAQRAAEFSSMLLDPSIRAIVPPWGGELAIDLISLLDFGSFSAAEPTWVLGYSDITTLMVPLTLLCGVATVHAPNLMDTPYRVEPPLRHWLDFVTAESGATMHQGQSAFCMGRGYHDYREFPEVRDWNPQQATSWKLLRQATKVEASGRLIGGCVETLAKLAGSRYGDVPGFARDYAPEDTLVYLEIAEAGAYEAARSLHGLRLAGWFDNANAVLLGRPAGYDEDGFTQLDACVDALGSLSIPVIYDMDFGHVPPQMTLVNGARATISVTPDSATLTQTLS
jgi:muramoyltetrapeptide carboxypeptidase LdcA involved in peptidoglycan recycling